MAEIQKHDVCRRIQEARRDAGVTQQQAADTLHVSYRAYQTWEADVVPWRRLDEIGRLYDVTKEWLLHGEDAATATPSQIDELIREVVEMRRELRDFFRRGDRGDGPEDPVN